MYNSEKDVSIKVRFAIRFIRAMKKLKAKNRHTNKRSYHMIIRDAAYASMASAVGPRRAWSRAIIYKIKNRRIRYCNNKLIRRRCRKRIIVNKANPIIKDSVGSYEQENDLRELVPGGEWMDSGSLLYETADYIKCLRAQVQVMTNILHHFTTS